MTADGESAVRPMPLKFGVGFVSPKPFPEELVGGYRYEQVGHHHNYHVTPDNWMWAAKPNYDFGGRYVIDGFSPNLNKTLHVGHLRNLALAHSLSRVLEDFCPKMVALLGCSLGVTKAATEQWEDITKMVGYGPKVYYDVVLPQDMIFTQKETLPPEEAERVRHAMNDGDPDPRADVWINPKGEEVKVRRSDGRPLYAYYDLVFAQEVGPTHYVTGHEQREHFESLGLGDKHLPMGLVLGADGTKLKSRTGDAMSVHLAMGTIIEGIAVHRKEKGPVPQLREIAWNIIAWNMLHAARQTNIKFEAEKWTRTEAPGMYITYTYARVVSALKCADRPDGRPTAFWDHSYFGDVTEEDAKLLGLAEQYTYYHGRAVELMDPAPIANFAHDLARAIGAAYEKEHIRDGRSAFYAAMSHAAWRLRQCIYGLGMFCVTEV